MRICIWLLGLISGFGSTEAFARLNQIDNKNGLRCELGVPVEHEKKVKASFYSRERHLEFCGRLIATLEILKIPPHAYKSIRFIGAFMLDPKTNKVVLVARTSAPDSPLEVFQPEDWNNKKQVSDELGRAAIYLASLVKNK